MKTKYSLYTSKEIKPTGWLKRQLEIQADGLSGNLDKVWPDVRDSKWIGGDCEGWERVPYWLDGFIPLAYLLENEDMIARAKKYIDAIIAGQQEDGWICPCTVEERPTYDTWAVQLISKVLTVYYECSGDEKILEVIYKTLKNYYELLKNGTISLFEWAKARWFETFIALNKLYSIYKEDWMKDLAKILKEQGLDYESYTEVWKHPVYKWKFETHIVNMGMMLKYEAVSAELLDAPYTKIADKLNDILSRYNGTPVELFTGDECLAGLSPIHGTECCAVAEQMYSYELLYAYTGDKKWAEKLEVLAFNAFPATNTEDMWGHQYDQLSNQMACVRFDGKNPFGTNGNESHLFGLEPNYGCCTANFNQAWPKFTLSTFMKTRNGILSAVSVPSKLTTEVKGIPVTVELITEYPFRNKLTYKIHAEKPVKFNFSARIPSFAKNVKVNGEEVSLRGNLSLDKEWTNETVEITFDTEITLVKRPHDLCCVKKGSLIFSVPVEYEAKMLEYTTRETVVRKFPYCDYEFYPTSDWNYAYASKDFKVLEADGDEFPFSVKNPRLMLEADVVHIDWGLEDGYLNLCAKTPKSRKPVGEVEKRKLQPYGCTNLRMTEIPFVNKK